MVLKRYYNGVVLELYWSRKIIKTLTHIFASGVVRGGVAQPLAAVSRRLGQVSGWAERGLAGPEFWALARCVGFAGWKRSKPKAQPVCGWVRWGAVGLAGVFGFGSLRWKVRWKMSKPKAQPMRVGALLKFPKFLKFLLH